MTAAEPVRRQRVAVIGGGIAGLAAAWELTGGRAGSGPDTPKVVVLEAANELGGKLRTATIGDRTVDVGPDGFLGRRPEAVDLCREIGIGGLLRPVGTTGAAVWARGRRRTLPAGLALGVPTRFWPVARSGIVGPTGSFRLLLDALIPRSDLRGPIGDRAIGPLVRRKLGQNVVDALVDPLVGGIHAGPVSDMSTAALFPLLLAVAQRRGSFMRSLREAIRRGGVAGPPSTVSPTDPIADPGAETAPMPAADDREEGAGESDETVPAFWALEGGMASLIEGLHHVLVARGVDVRRGSCVELLDRSAVAGAWAVLTGDRSVVADGVVLAVPAPVAAQLLDPHDTDAATLLRGIDYSTVATVTLVYPETARQPDWEGTGLLVPHGTPTPPALGTDEPFLVTACTYLSTKWPHLARPGEVLLRASVGRFGDDRPAALSDETLEARVTGELAFLLGLEGEPLRSQVTRWPAAFPQYRVHHLLRVAGIESATRRLPALAVAGASLRGVGIPACIASGRAAARAVLGAMAEQPTGAGSTP